MAAKHNYRYSKKQKDTVLLKKENTLFQQVVL